MAITEVDRLSAGKYLLLTTFRKDGTPMPSPVWVTRDDDRLLVWTAANSGKVKRIRRDGHVELAPCDVRGTPTGASVTGTAQLLDEVGTATARRLIAKKYPLTGRLLILGSAVRRGARGTVGIAIEPSTNS
ncbi:PPOX class F420-dependent oxidoreductase [Kutzneria sp. CA-103260]|uniref:PPOX class F420-dependent oxidoreductase n=1 Tax=Kutzneria sp. CA-103260 TaxID=2802641 RepID=UPI001BEF533F|nr:PPOX class F420-dependent oxidoreductase [Kutzneria sp. CA-103260]QUQ71756.1 pyridoxamine 5'-phosphate oxidase [Kutzneria sp. CA-103260]